MKEQTTLEPGAWEVTGVRPILQHPFVTVTMEQIRLPDGQLIEEWPKIHTRDYVNAVVLNEAGEALILEGYKHGTGWSSWQMLSNYLEDGENPLTAAQRQLLAETGYRTSAWSYLGSYVVDPNRHVGVGHFFCAHAARPATPPENGNPAATLRWVPITDLRFALLDGRIANLSDAIAISLALLTVIQ
jgi:8-oxo-dGTP pyrophosphatase MutT (NUDIX family)